MDNFFKIYVEQLRDGHKEKIHESFAPDFMDVKEKELRFVSPIEVDGEAYLAEQMLILHFKVLAKAEMPCSICNEFAEVVIDIPDFYHAVPMESIKSGIFDFKEILRENILLETPAFAEHQGYCPKRKEIEKYLKNEKNDPHQEEGYQPFANLDWIDKGEN